MTTQGQPSGDGMGTGYPHYPQVFHSGLFLPDPAVPQVAFQQ
ncbi:hypothetical protein [Arthrobacter sp. DR-2P]|nr:hypothetical protein [Arthrobacter sp. DR-2P]